MTMAEERPGGGLLLGSSSIPPPFPPLTSSTHNHPILLNPQAPPFAPVSWSRKLFSLPHIPDDLKLSYSPPLRKGDRDVAVCSRAEVDRTSETWSEALQGFFADKCPYLPVVITAIKKRWELKDAVEILHRPDGSLIFLFSSSEERKRVLASGPWFIMGRYLHIRPWSRSIRSRKDFFASMPVWIHLPNLPLHLWSPCSMGKIASVVGKPLFLDENSAKSSKISYARLCVEISADRPPPSFVWVEVEGCTDEAMQQPVEYETIFKICTKCKVFGHSSNLCSNFQEITPTVKAHQKSKMVGDKNLEIARDPKKVTEIGHDPEKGWTQVQAKKKRLEKKKWKQVTSSTDLISRRSQPAKLKEVIIGSVPRAIGNKDDFNGILVDGPSSSGSKHAEPAPEKPESLDSATQDESLSTATKNQGNDGQKQSILRQPESPEITATENLEIPEISSTEIQKFSNVGSVFHAYPVIHADPDSSVPASQTLGLETNCIAGPNKVICNFSRIVNDELEIEDDFRPPSSVNIAETTDDRLQIVAEIMPATCRNKDLHIPEDQGEGTWLEAAVHSHNEVSNITELEHVNPDLRTSLAIRIGGSIEENEPVVCQILKSASHVDKVLNVLTKSKKDASFEIFDGLKDSIEDGTPSHKRDESPVLIGNSPVQLFTLPLPNNSNTLSKTKPILSPGPTSSPNPNPTSSINSKPNSTQSTQAAHLSQTPSKTQSNNSNSDLIPSPNPITASTHAKTMPIQTNPNPDYPNPTPINPSQSNDMSPELANQGLIQGKSTEQGSSRKSSRIRRAPTTLKNMVGPSGRELGPGESAEMTLKLKKAFIKEADLLDKDKATQFIKWIYKAPDEDIFKFATSGTAVANWIPPQSNA